jgi:hypothetical protein
MGAFLTSACLILKKSQVSKVAFYGPSLQANDTIKIQLPVVGGMRVWTKTLLAGELTNSGGKVYARANFPVPTFVPDTFDIKESSTASTFADDLGEATVTLTRNNNVIDSIISGVVAEA